LECWLAGQVEHVGGVVLEAPGELVGIGKGLELAVAGAGAELLAVEGADQLELAELGGGGEVRVADVAEGGLGGLLPRAAEGRALEHGGEEAAAVVAGAAVGEGRAEGDERGQVLALGAEAVGDPGPHRGPELVGGAGVEEERGGAVGDALGVHRAHHAVVIRVAGEVREEFRDPAAALAALAELPERLHHAAGRAGAGLGDRALVEELEHPPVVGVERGLVIEAVEVAHAAAHKEEDHPLGARAVVAGAGGERVGAAGGGLGRHPREGEETETAGEPAERLPAGEREGRIHRRGQSR